jgi:hypothetical protein
MAMIGGNLGTALMNFVNNTSIKDGLKMGNAFGSLGFKALCGGLDLIGAPDQAKELVHREVRVSAVWKTSSLFSGAMYPGMPLTNGRNCKGKNKPNRTGWSVGVPKGVPDFILGDKPIQDKRVNHVSFNHAFTVGDFKWSLKALHDDYAAKNPRKPNQWTAITGYAKNHTYSRTALFIVGHNKKGLLGGVVTSNEKSAILGMMADTLITQGVIPLVVVVVD